MLGGVLGGVLAAAALALVHCASLEGLAQTNTDASTSPDGAGIANGDDASREGAAADGGEGGGAPGLDGAVLDGVAPLGAGQIYCASTTTACDVQKAQCCVTLSGTDSAAARTYSTSSAQCGPIGGGNCGSFIAAGNDFTMKFPQRCGTAADCQTGESCCVLPLTMGDRFAKEVGGIGCLAAPTCAMTGRAICAGPTDCAATESCLPETDPVLSHVYATFCR